MMNDEQFSDDGFPHNKQMHFNFRIFRIFSPSPHVDGDLPEGIRQRDLCFTESHGEIAESGRRKAKSAAACAKKGASGRMQRPAELVPIPECGVKASEGFRKLRESSVKAPESCCIL